MEHLTLETLARLVDETPDPDERGHLDRCDRCREELESLRVQTLALSRLPDLRPPAGDWERLESRLYSERLLRSGSGRKAGGTPVRTPWLQLAAAFFLVVIGAGAGTGLGLSLGQERGSDPPVAVAPGVPSVTSVVGVSDTGMSLSEAEDLVRLTEGWYLEALIRYREQAGGAESPGTDPVTRYAALEALTAAGHAAVRELPADPFLNGILVNMEAERAATLRGMRASTTRDWY